MHKRKTIFQRFVFQRFTSKFKQIFIKRSLVEFKLYKKKWEVCMH